MKQRITALFIASVLAYAPHARAEIKWNAWSNDIFTQAEKDKKLVILDLEAVWCHWCHVMEHETYSDAAVAKLIGDKFIAVRVDQDARPDISRKYEEWGWPATIIFNGKGEELVKLRGFQRPSRFLETLSSTVKNPVPMKEEVERDEPTSTVLGKELRAELIESHKKGIDRKAGGLDSSHKYIDSDSLEYAIERALEGDKDEEAWAKLTLDNNLKLLDPAWGGVYQYSTDYDWDHAHFEKIMSMQLVSLLSYSQAFGLWRDPKYLEGARGVYRFLTGKLQSPEGAFYTSQDADLVQGEHAGDYFLLDAAEREKKGIPRIDTHLYARENGWVVEGILSLYAATGEGELLRTAVKTAEWIHSKRRNGEGGYSHDEKDVSGPYLGDSLAAGRAFLAVYAATGDRAWLGRAEETLKYIEKNFFTAEPGAVTARPDPKSPIAPSRSLDENTSLLRFANLASRYTGNASYKALAEKVMPYLTKNSVATSWITGDGVLLSADELGKDPLHLTVVGPKDDPKAKELFVAALAIPSRYKRLEWWDKREGPMPNPDVQYPDLPKPAAFICTNSRCSLPIFNPADIRKTVVQFLKWPVSGSL